LATTAPLTAPANDENNWTWMLISPRGRVGRSTYVAGSIALVFGLILFVKLLQATVGTESMLATVLWPPVCLGSLWALAMLQIKRWHDRGRSGLWMLLSAVPIIGPIWSFVELVLLPGDVLDNTYGPPPS